MNGKTKPSEAAADPAAAWLVSCRGALAALGLFSGVLNLMALTGSLFMLQVYDRVLASRSLATLVALLVLVALLYAAQTVLDAVRARILVRLACLFDEAVSPSVHAAILRLPLLAGGRDHSLQPLAEMDRVRAFLAGPGPAALLDLPWIPLYLGLCFLFHPWIGMTALAGSLVLVALTLVAEVLSRARARAIATTGAKRARLAQAGHRNAEAVRAMGMAPRLGELWAEANLAHRESWRRTADIVGTLGAVSRAARIILQSAVLAVGAWLAIREEVTGGAIIAAAILTARALAPVDQAITHWRSFASARLAWRRLKEALDKQQPQTAPLELPWPSTSLSVEGVAVSAPGILPPLLRDVRFELTAGQALGVIGPSGSGKSTLGRALVGLWPPLVGQIRLDGAPLERWSPALLGHHVGYLPQDVQLLDGTVSQNISRFAADAASDAILKAAKAAGVHDMILRLPEGYETRIGEDGAALSAGQRQRLALARALYGDPFLVVLDEPNANLDLEGEHALKRAILAIRRRGGIAVVIAHHPAALAGTNLVLTLVEGRMRAIERTEDVLQRMRRPQASARPVSLLKDREARRA